MSSFLEKFSEENKPDGIKLVEYDVEKDNEYKNKKNKKIIINIILAIIFIIIGIVLYINLNKKTVPDFNNQLTSVVTKWSTKNDIEVTIKEEYNNDYLEGYVIKQSIKSKNKIDKKTVLTVTVSKGANPNENIKLPDINNMTGSQIKDFIDENKLTNTTIKEENSTTVEKGKVISYTFDSVTVDNNNFKRSDTLNIIISKGPITYEKNIEVINLVSKTKDEVSKWCNDNNLVCKYTESLSDVFEVNKIISQSKVVGEVISKDTEISFEVSVGSGIIVPDYSKVNMDNAANLNSKFEIKTKLLYNMQVSYGQLISQSVAPNTRKQESDNKIELIYSLGRPYFNSLEGTSEADLAKTFYDYNQKGVKFNYTIKYVDSSKTKGSVVWSSKSNEFVTMNESIEIHVSNGNGVD